MTAGARPAFWVSSDALDLGQLSGNSATGSGIAGFFLAGTVATSSTWRAQPAPWLLSNSGCSGFAPFTLTIAAGVTATAEAGTIVKSSPSSFDCDGAREVCLERETGFLLPAGDVKGLGDRLVELAENPELRVRFGRSGRSLVRRNFSVELMVDQLAGLYERLWKERNGMSPAAR